MKIKADYVIRQVMDTYLVVGIGKEAYAPNLIMTLNETGAFLWHMLENGAEKGELVNSLIREYDVDAESAGKDVDAFIAQLWEKALMAE